MESYHGIQVATPNGETSVAISLDGLVIGRTVEYDDGMNESMDVYRSK